MRDGRSAFLVGNPVGGRWSLWKTSNGGVNWDSTGLFLSQPGSEIGWNNSLAIMNSNIWFGTNNTRIYKSTNNGVNWSAISTSPEVNSSAVWIYFDTTSYTFAYSGGNNVYYTTNGGVNWTQKVCPDTGSFMGFCPAYFGVDFGPQASYCIRNYSKVYFSNQSSNFFADYTAPSGIYNHMAYDGNIGFGGYTWAVRSNGGITRISLFRGGAVRTISLEIPELYKLEQNFPNPFNPSTSVRFDLPRTALTNIKVYDIIGREVATLVNEQLHAGKYEAAFDASNLASGIYFYKINAGSFVDVKKMIVIK